MFAPNCFYSRKRHSGFLCSRKYTFYGIFETFFLYLFCIIIIITIFSCRQKISLRKCFHNSILSFQLQSSSTVCEGSDRPKQLICLLGICRLKAEMIASMHMVLTECIFRGFYNSLTKDGTPMITVFSFTNWCIP